ncbi:hypothetical protein ABIB48_001393 [Arthrobacter sp. UYCu511]
MPTLAHAHTGSCTQRARLKHGRAKSGSFYRMAKMCWAAFVLTWYGGISQHFLEERKRKGCWLEFLQASTPS